MDLSRVLSELRVELERLDAAILTLERLKGVGPPKRGRPPKIQTEVRKPVRGLAIESVPGKPEGGQEPN